MRENKVEATPIIADETLDKDEPRVASPEARLGVEEHCVKLLQAIWAGESALHLAVVNGDLPAVKYLISKGADVNFQTTKQLFEETSKSVESDRKPVDKYKAFGYYGEYPLSFAAVFNHTEIYDHLIQCGANTDAQDSYGNTVLHVIVIHNQIDMFSYAMRHPWKRANPWTKNNDDLTPIALCCQLGFAGMFNEIMELSRVEISKYSDLESSLYPMPSFDTIGVNGATDHQSALMILVNGEEQGHLDMLNHVVVKKILAEKWRVFVKRRFIQRLVLATLHVIFMSMAIYLRPVGRSIGYEDPRDAIRYLSELTIFCGSCTTFMMHVEEIKTSGFRTFARNLRNAPSKVLMLGSTFLIMSMLNVRLIMFINPSGNHKTLIIVEEALFALAAPGSWAFLLFFLKTHSRFGPLIITLYTMVAKDVTKVMVIFIVFWFMFAVVFLYLYKGSGLASLEGIEDSIMTVFHMNFGSFEYKHFELSKFPALAAAIFFLVMLVMPILLLNMLIATMGNTFNRVIVRSQQEWYHQYAKTVIILERAFPKEKLEKFQKLYTEPLSKDTMDCRYTKGKNRGYLQDMGDDWLIAGLSVTMKVANTKAFVKKRSFKNWKWLYGTLRALLKAKRAEIKEDRRVTFWDLFGTDDILDSEYLREKMVAENLRKISLTHLFQRNYDHDNILDVANMALSAKAPDVTDPKTKAARDANSAKPDSLDILLNDAV